MLPSLTTQKDEIMRTLWQIKENPLHSADDARECDTWKIQEIQYHSVKWFYNQWLYYSYQFQQCNHKTHNCINISNFYIQHSFFNSFLLWIFFSIEMFLNFCGWCLKTFSSLSESFVRNIFLYTIFPLDQAI